MMFRWVLFVFLALIFLSWLFSKRLPWLEKLGLTSFNSSLDFKILGKQFRIPVTLAAVLATVLFVLGQWPVSYTHLRAHETVLDLVCRLLLEKKTTDIL